MQNLIRWCQEQLNSEKDEEDHEKSLAGMIEEDFLSYMGSIVLGLNDALVELTGTLAGLTLALQNWQTSCDQRFGNRDCGFFFNGGLRISFGSSR